MIVVANRVLQALGYATASAVEVTERLGVSRSQAYVQAARLEQALPRLTAPPEPAPAAPDEELAVRYAVASEVLRYLVEHPGAMIAGPERHRYSDDFRRFVLRLQQPGEAGASLSTAAFADAVHVPLETLRDWRGERRRTPVEASPASPDPPDPPVFEDGVLAQIVALWRQCRGVTVAAFARILAEQHRIEVSVATLVELLELSGDRKRSRPHKPKPDPEAIRGAVERFFPGAQWVADGTSISVELDGQRFAFNWELLVDGFSGAHTGFVVSDAEDARALIEATDAGVVTTGAAPLAVLSDNLPANHCPEATEALEARGVLPMASTPYRAQNKADVEGAFGLFSQTMAPLRIDAPSERERARQIVQIALVAYCCGRNHVPRKGLKGRSAAQVYLAACPSAEEREAALERLRQIQRRILERRAAGRKRVEPTCRALLERAFDELGLSDPEGHFVPAIAAYGLGATTEAIAILRAKLADGWRCDLPERYLLGIARNVATRDEDQAVYEHLLALRVQAREELLEPLIVQDEERRRRLDRHRYVDATLDDALRCATTIDRAFWRLRLLEALAALPEPERGRRVDDCARLVAVSYRTPPKERDALIARLAALRVPLAA